MLLYSQNLPKKRKMKMVKITKELEDELEDLFDLRKLTSRDLSELGGEILTKMRSLIGRGFSPITGRKFPRYKNPSKYPGTRKRSSPVNLELTGDFLKSLRARGKTGKIPRLSIFLQGRESIEKERGHRTGANGQPKRPIIPLEREGFTKSVNNVIDDVIEDIVNKRLD